MTRSTARLCIAAALLALAAPAGAQERSDGLRLLMERTPMPADGIGQGWEFYFADITAARQAVDRTFDDALANLMGTADPIAAFQRLTPPPAALLHHSLPAGLDGQWRELVGFDPGDLETVASAGRVPETVEILTLTGPEALERLAPALLDNGYAERSLEGWQAWWRGEQDFNIYLTQRNIADPFGGPLGRSARVATDGVVIAHSPGWTLIEAMADGAQPMLAADPRIAVLLDALDDPRFGEAALIAGYLLASPSPAEDPAAGLPPWQIGFFADLSTGRTDHALVMVVYEDRATAESAADMLSNAWQTTGPARLPDRTYADMVPGKSQTYVTGDGPAAIVLAITPAMGDPADRPQNTAYSHLLDTYFRGEFDLIAVAGGSDAAE